MCSTNNNTKKVIYRKRVPKRGPGVAELEKILRAQQNTTTQDHFSPFVSSPSSNSSAGSVVDHRLQRPPHQTYFPFHNDNKNSNKVINTNYSLAENNKINNMVGKYIHCEDLFLPEISEGYVSSMMNSFPGSMISSHAGLWHPKIEPPSTQTSLTNNPSIGPPQPKFFVGSKRPLTVDNNHRHPSLPSNNNNNKKQISEKSVPVSDCLGFNSMPISRDCEYTPTKNGIVSPVMIPNFDFIPFQGNMMSSMECVNKISIASSDQKKPFFNFFPSNDQTVTKGAIFDMNTIKKRNKSGQDGIDLNLKLSST